MQVGALILPELEEICECTKWAIDCFISRENLTKMEQMHHNLLTG
jgi:hypothetical protein